MRTRRVTGSRVAKSRSSVKRSEPESDREQRALARVGVAHQRHDMHALACPAAAVQRALLAYVVDLARADA